VLVANSRLLILKDKGEYISNVGNIEKKIVEFLEGDLNEVFV
jgi:hypothetical protein